MTRRAALMVVAAILIFAPGRLTQASGTVGNDQADVVYGQSSMFTGSGLCIPPSANSLCEPSGIAVDGAGNLWVVDEHNDRVVMYAPGSTTASKVLGQPDLMSKMPGVTASVMNNPYYVAVDANDTLYVADSGAARVLVFFHAAEKASGAAADLVLGQPNFTSSTVNNPSTAGTGNGATCPTPDPASQCTLYLPSGLTIDRHGDLLVVDTANNRALLWPATDFDPDTSVSCVSACYIPATRSWGQFGSLTSNVANQLHSNSGTGDPCSTNSKGQPSQCTLDSPESVAVDSQDDLFVVDDDNCRVLEYDNAVVPGGTRQDATMVYGQGGSFTSNTPNNGGVNASSLWSPIAVIVDAAGGVWIDDPESNRVLGYPPAVALNRTVATTANAVLGQRGSFLTFAPDKNGLDAGSLNTPFDVAADSSGDLFVADFLNNRVLEYFQPYTIAARVALAAGWNLVSIADTAQFPYTASSVVQQIDNQGGSASEVAVFSGGAYQVFVPGFSTDFGISPKQGVWVLSGENTIWAQS